MGYTFAAALVKKTGTAPQTRKAIREGLENLGCRKASNAEDASLVLPLHHDKKSAWMTIALEMGISSAITFVSGFSYWYCLASSWVRVITSTSS